VVVAQGRGDRSPTGEAMFPVRCFTCGKVIGQYWEEYQQRIREEPPGKVLDDLEIERYCCRRMFLTHKEVFGELVD
jgi:DNA-directed RNA polymerase subunit N